MNPAAKRSKTAPRSSVGKKKSTKAKDRARPVKGAISKPNGPELKYIDRAVADYVADTTGSITLLNGVAVGDDNTDREGRQVNIKSVQIKGRCHPFDTTTLPTHARIILVWDNATNGTAPTIADVMTAVNSNSFPLVNNANRFTILRDMSFPIGGISTTASSSYAMSPSVHIVDAYLKIGQLTQYVNTGATAASVQNGGLFMITIGDQAAAAGGQFSVAVRVRFTDV